MNYALICDHFPRLEYFFGCYIPRFAAVAKLRPHQVTRAFAENKAELAEETIRQLRLLIHYCNVQSRPENTAREFLSTLACPYDSPEALAWLGSVCDSLAHFAGKSGDGESPRSATASARWELLSEVEELNASELPLNLPYVLLRPYGRLKLFGPTTGTPDLSFERIVLLPDCIVLFRNIQTLRSQPLPLLEVPFCLGAK